MAVQHTTDNDTTEKAKAPKKTSPRKARTPKNTSKTSADSTEKNVQIEANAPAFDEQKTPAPKRAVPRKRSVKKTTQEKSLDAPADEMQLKAAPAKVEAEPAKKVTPRKTRAKSQKTETSQETPEVVSEIQEKKVAPKRPAAVRGRPRKKAEPVLASSESPALPEVQEQSDLSTKTESPLVTVTEKRKPRPRTSKPKAPKDKENLLQEASSAEAEPITPTESASQEASQTPTAAEEVSTPSRRGRRGGRGKRGKKRSNLLQGAAEQDTKDKAESPKKSVGTSLDTGKPGIARSAASKKTESAQRKMFISMVQGEQVEVALVENGIIHEYYLEMLHQMKTKGNIYKGVVNNIDTNLQAAFVNYGTNKNGFLQIDEIHPEYYQSHHESVKGKKFPPIQKIIKPGQEILVQVVKEPTGNKGAFLTTWLSLAGRFLVLTPGQEQIGVSRKVDNDEERVRLREMMTGIEPGQGLGVIVRTVSAGTSKTTLKSDLQYLKRVWKEIRKRGVNEGAPALLHRETSLAQRAIRDYLTDDVTEVWVDNTEVAESLRETVSLLFPRKKELIRIHADVRQTLWERFNMHRQLEQIYAREVLLPSGGRLVFDQTEALMAIDINSGKISGKGNFESMALKTNIEAAETIARHLKLRDIGGQVVIDFIEMRDRSHVREVEKTLRNAMKSDRARHDVARMSSFGLLEIVRQRTGSSALAITMEPCPHCRGTGVRRNLEWQALQALCEIERKGRATQGGKYVYETNLSELALYLLNHKRQRIAELEEQLKIRIEIVLR